MNFRKIFTLPIRILFVGVLLVYSPLVFIVAYSIDSKTSAKDVWLDIFEFIQYLWRK